MAVRKVSISLSLELEQALAALAQARSEDRSRLVETLLRESPLVAREVARLRGTGTPPRPRPARDDLEALALGRLAEREWARREKAGEVGFLAR